MSFKCLNVHTSASGHQQLLAFSGFYFSGSHLHSVVVGPTPVASCRVMGTTDSHLLWPPHLESCGERWELPEEQGGDQKRAWHTGTQGRAGAGAGAVSSMMWDVPSMLSLRTVFFHRQIFINCFHV